MPQCLGNTRAGGQDTQWPGWDKVERGSQVGWPCASIIPGGPHPPCLEEHVSQAILCS